MLLLICIVKQNLSTYWVKEYIDLMSQHKWSIYWCSFAKIKCNLQPKWCLDIWVSCHILTIRVTLSNAALDLSFSTGLGGEPHINNDFNVVMDSLKSHHLSKMSKWCSPRRLKAQRCFLQTSVEVDDISDKNVNQTENLFIMSQVLWSSVNQCSSPKGHIKWQTNV